MGKRPGMTEWRVLLKVERVFRAAQRKAGPLAPCRAGCDSCCKKPFAITEAGAVWFFQRHHGLACPVLDPSSGVCLLHSARPVACRLYGPLIQIGDTVTAPYPLCYEGVPGHALPALAARLDGEEFHEPPGVETLIAFALLPRPSGGLP
jgi:hypothetical protein